MATKPAHIDAASLSLDMTNPLASVEALGGILVADVGQGDAIGLLDQGERIVAWIDYGGKQSSPFLGLSGQPRIDKIDAHLPAGPALPVFLSHWDEDHWYSARPGAAACETSAWLVPRQWPSPAAVRRSREIKTIRCFPESLASPILCFVARNGDELWCEKLKPFRSNVASEDCNRSGLAFSVVRKKGGKVIFLPGDAPFHLPKHYRLHRAEGYKMRGLVAFHHGAGAHWTKGTRAFLKRWASDAVGPVVAFSYGDPNGYGHPLKANYGAFPVGKQLETPGRRAGAPLKILF